MNRDAAYLRQQAKENITRYVNERLPEEYEKCLVGYLLIDELDKLSKSSEANLLNLMENGMLVEMKVRKTRCKYMRVSVFATCNQVEKISLPLRSRFIVVHLPEYTFKQFTVYIINSLHYKCKQRLYNIKYSSSILNLVIPIIWMSIYRNEKYELSQMMQT
jgi:MoxR-like ATPase